VKALSDLFSHDEILMNVGKLFEAIGSIDKVTTFVNDSSKKVNVFNLLGRGQKRELTLV